MSWFLTQLACLFIKLLNLTYRFDYHNLNSGGSESRAYPGPYLISCWHQQLFGGMLSQRDVPLVVIASRSKDADPVAQTLVSLGHVPVRGSSSRNGRDKGGKEAKDQMIEMVKQGKPGGVTPDGPKGPAREVKAGIVDVARKTGAPIIPMVARSRRYWEFNSWDRFQVPKPFSRVHVYYGEAIEVPQDLKFEDFPAWQKRVGEAMNALDERAVQDLQKDA